MGGGACSLSVACSSYPRRSSCPHQCVSSNTPLINHNIHTNHYLIFPIFNTLAVILFRLHDALEAFLVHDVFLVMHELFAGRFVDPHVHIHIHIHNQNTIARVSTHQETHGCAGSDQVALPDNSEVRWIHH